MELTIEARGMSKVTKTILILQRSSWTAAHPHASCCPHSTSRLLLFHFHWWNSCISTPSPGRFLWRRQTTNVSLKALQKGSSLQDPVLPGLSWVLSSYPTGQIADLLLTRPACLHFTRTLVWSHSNQEDPASLCWLLRRLIWISGGGVRVWQLARRELLGRNSRPGASDNDKCCVWHFLQATTPLVSCKTHPFPFF